MRIAYLTAGAGGMYCGSCMRDNTLAAALRRQGRDVRLIPVFSPVRTDEPDVSEACVYYGGVNVYLQQRFALMRYLPRWMDRVLDRPGLLRRVTSGVVEASPKSLGELTVSILEGARGAQRKELRRLCDGLRAMEPDVVHLPDALFIGIAEEVRRATGAGVVCALSGEDLFLDKLPERHRARAVALMRDGARHVDAFAAATAYYGRTAAEQFGIPEERVRAIPLGVRIEDDQEDERFAGHVPSASGDGGLRTDRPFTIGYLARTSPEKGLHLLVDAFIEMKRSGRSLRLRVAGHCPRGDARYMAEQRERVAAAGFSGDAEFLGEVDREGKRRLLGSVDVFSVPSVYREAKGIYAVEALGRGVPIVEPRHGAFPELIEATGGGMLFEPGDASDLARALAGLMDDEERRRAMGEAGRRVVRERMSDERMADASWAVFEECARKARAGA